MREIKRIVYYLPMYNSSCRNIADTKAVMTVARGLNITQYRGPLPDMHQD